MKKILLILSLFVLISSCKPSTTIILSILRILVENNSDDILTYDEPQESESESESIGSEFNRLTALKNEYFKNIMDPNTLLLNLKKEKNQEQLTDTEFHYLLGEVFLVQEKFNTACHHFALMATCNKIDTEPYILGMAMMEFSRNEFETSINYVDQLIELDPLNDQSYWILTQIYRGDKDTTFQNLELSHINAQTALNLSESFDNHLQMAHYYNLINKNKKAVYHIEQAKKIRPNFQPLAIYEICYNYLGGNKKWALDQIHNNLRYNSSSKKKVEKIIGKSIEDIN